MAGLRKALAQILLGRWGRTGLHHPIGGAGGKPSYDQRGACQLDSEAGHHAYEPNHSLLLITTAALMSVVIGIILFMHGWQKFKGGFTGVAGFMTRNGLVPGQLFAGAAMFLETVGAFKAIIGCIKGEAQLYPLIFAKRT